MTTAPSANPSRVIASPAQDQVSLDLKTVDLGFLAGELVSKSRLRPEQLRVAVEFERFARDAAEIAAAGQSVPFGRIIQPPRTGKTVVAAHLIARTRLPSVFIVPTRALVGQTAREMAVHAPSIPVGTFYGERKDVVTGGVNITTYAMLVAAWEADRLPVALRDSTLVFADEGHRAMTPRRLAALRNAFPASALRVALTATPNYDDPARRLELYFPALIHEITMDEALSLGLLAPLACGSPRLTLTHRPWRSSPETSKAKRSGG